MRSLLFFLLFQFSFTANAQSSWVYDPAGPLYQYNRYTGACADAKGTQGLNKDYLGECGNLVSANLRGKDLSGITFLAADFSGAVIADANLTNADLRSANMAGTNWIGAKLNGVLYSKNTFLPFAESEATKLGMVRTDFDKLDSQLVIALDAWLKSGRMTELPPAIQRLIFLRANYFGDATYRIFESLRMGGTVLFDELLKMRIDLNFQPKDRDTFLVSVIRNLGYVTNEITLRVATYLLDHDADPNLPSREDATPLMVAVEKNATDVVKLLLSRGANPNQLSRGKSVLAQAITNMKPDLALLLIESGARIDVCNEKNTCSILELSLKNSVNSPLTKKLIGMGASAAQSFEKKSMLDYGRDIETLTTLIGLGADPKYASILLGQTEEVLVFLLDRGADINEVAANGGETLLLRGVKQNKPALVELAFKYKANLDIADSAGFAAFGYILANEDLTKKYFDRFLKAGVNPNFNVPLKYGFKHSMMYVTQYADDDFFNRHMCSLYMPLARAGGDQNTIFKNEARSAFSAFVAVCAPIKDLKATEEILTELIGLGADIHTLEQSEHIFPYFATWTNWNRYAFVFSARFPAPRTMMARAFASYPYDEMTQLGKLLAKLGIDPAGPQDTHGSTLAHLSYNLESLKRAQNFGDPMTGINNLGENPIFGANAEMVMYMLKNGVPLIKENKEGDSPLLTLHYNFSYSGPWPAMNDVPAMKALIGLGASTGVLSKRYNFHLAHLLVYGSGEHVKNIEDRRKVWNEFKSYKMDLNQMWLTPYFEGKLVPAAGMLGAALVGNLENKGELFPADNKSFVEFVKDWIRSGYDPKLEEAKKSQGFPPLADMALEVHNIELAKFLISQGLEFNKRSSSGGDYPPPPPENACEFFSGANYKPDRGGCFSTSGFIWTRPGELVANREPSDDRKKMWQYCQSVYGQLPGYPQLAREYFVGGAKSAFVVYDSGENTLLKFNIRTGVAERVEEGDKLRILCLK